MEYENKRTGDFWKRFRDAEPHSIPIRVHNVQRYAAELLLDLKFDTPGRKSYRYSFIEESDALAFWREMCAPPRENFYPLERCVYVAMLENPKICSCSIEEVENAILERPSEPLPLCLNQICGRIRNYALIDAVAKYIDSNSLWFDQKVLVGFYAAAAIFSPRGGRSAYKMTDGQKLQSAEDNKPCWRHQYVMSQDEWASGGYETIIDAVVDAYSREISAIDVDKLDFSCFRDLFGVDYERVLSKIKPVLIAFELAMLNRVLFSNIYSLSSDFDSSFANFKTKVESSLYCERHHRETKLRRPVEFSFQTCDEEICVQVWEQQAWRRHKIFSVASSFFGGKS